MTTLHFRAHSFLNVLRYTFCSVRQLQSRELLLHFSTLTLILTLYLCYTVNHSMPSAVYNCVLPGVYVTHQ